MSATELSDWDGDELARAHTLAAELRKSIDPGKLFAVRAPGRVNLIGEHTDYSNLPVMPIAIDRSTIIVGAARDDARLELRNINPAFPPREFHLAPRVPPYSTGDWGNYVKAGIQGVIDHFGKRSATIENLRGATMMVDGRVPLAAGLSSSAALTVSSALALMAANKLTQDPLETAQMVARSEWYVGTMAGGMDQAASMLGQREHALLIHFNPLRVTPVPMPPGAAVIVADSLEVAAKSGKVREEYNRRVLECAIAAQILARTHSMRDAKVLGDLVKAGTGTARDLIETLAAKVPKAISIQQAAKLLDIEEDRLLSALLGGSHINIDVTRPLAILRRARHVLTEAERVELAADALASGRLEEMGLLMNASHESLRDDFDASTMRLDAMVACARDAGALGARLTGAGFGGCIVALARETDAPQVLERLENDYYAKLGADATSRALHAVVHAGAGASVIELP